MIIVPCWTSLPFGFSFPFLHAHETKRQSGLHSSATSVSEKLVFVIWKLPGNINSHKLIKCSPHTNLGQGGSRTGALRGHRQDRGDAQSHPGRRSIHVYPERHPGQDVHLDEVVAHLTLQVEFNLDAGEFTFWHKAMQCWNDSPWTTEDGY